MDEKNGNQLRYLRKKMGISTLQLSVEAHTSTATLQAIERFGHKPGSKVQQKIADALKVKPEQIWTGVAHVSERDLVLEVVLENLLDAVDALYQKGLIEPPMDKGEGSLGSKYALALFDARLMLGRISRVEAKVYEGK